MINKDQLRELITDVLKEFDMNTEGRVRFSENAVELLMLTAAHESHLGTYIKQTGEGPALGIFQMEPTTEKDIWDNYLKYQYTIAEAVALCYSWHEEELMWNLKYSILMARVHYFRVSAGLPTTPEGHAKYAKVYYNTHLGKATEAEYLEDYLKYATKCE